MNLLLNNRFGSPILIALGLLAVILAPSARGQTNLPASWSFEDLTAGTPVVSPAGVGIQNWGGGPYSSSPTNPALVVTSGTYPAPGGAFPLPSATHSNVVQLFGNVSNRFATVSLTNVWVDTVVKADRLTVDPDIDNDLQLAAYFNSNGFLVVHHAAVTQSFSVAKQYWTVLDAGPFSSNDWVRLTLELVYLPEATPEIESLIFDGDPEGWLAFKTSYPLQFSFFQVHINGGSAATSPMAYRSTSIPDAALSDLDFPSSEDNQGTWFLTADSGFSRADTATPQNPYITDLAFQGSGYLDDIVVTDVNPMVASVGWTITPLANDGGTVQPGTPQTVTPGGSTAFTITATNDCWQANVTVESIIDGVTNLVWQGVTNAYAFANVTNDFNLNATFEPKPPLEAWLCQQGLDVSLMDWDQDGDGATPREEFYAGTDENDPTSVFRIIIEEFLPGSNRVVWTATTNSGIFTPFIMLRSTNVLTDADWITVATNLVRSATGTNTWFDLNPPAIPAMYRPAIPTNTP